MGKRSSGFAKRANSFYSTPYRPAMPVLFPFLPPKIKFIEPMAGDGRMIRFLEDQGHECIYACDIAPKPYMLGMEPMGNTVIHKRDLFDGGGLPPCDYVITNPAWDRNKDGTGILHDLMRLVRNHEHAWLLFDADWAHCLMATEFGQFCQDIVPVGRVKWIEDSEHGGKDNVCWYHFVPHSTQTIFHWRTGDDA